MCAEKSLYSPERRGAKHCDEEAPRQSTRYAVLAPTLEHGNYSNYKEDDRNRSSSLNPHVLTHEEEIDTGSQRREVRKSHTRVTGE